MNQFKDFCSTIIFFFFWVIDTSFLETNILTRSKAWHMAVFWETTCHTDYCKFPLQFHQIEWYFDNKHKCNKIHAMNILTANRLLIWERKLSNQHFDSCHISCQNQINVNCQNATSWYTSCINIKAVRLLHDLIIFAR